VVPSEIYDLYNQYGNNYEHVYEKASIDFLTDSVRILVMVNYWFSAQNITHMSFLSAELRLGNIWSKV